MLGSVMAVEACHGGGWVCYGQVCSGGQGAARYGSFRKVPAVKVRCVLSRQVAARHCKAVKVWCGREGRGTARHGEAVLSRLGPECRDGFRYGGQGPA